MKRSGVRHLSISLWKLLPPATWARINYAPFYVQHDDYKEPWSLLVKLDRCSHITIIYRVWYCISYGMENKLFFKQTEQSFFICFNGYYTKNVCILTQKYLSICPISNNSCLPIRSYWMRAPTCLSDKQQNLFTDTFLLDAVSHMTLGLATSVVIKKVFYWKLLATTITIYKLKVLFLDLRLWQIVI